jgi:DNA repair ATPase RecN
VKTMPIARNQNPEYRRERRMAFINASDVAVPEDLVEAKSSCLIKMTNPFFGSFVTAFLDHESRIRPLHEVPEQHHGCLTRVQLVGGYQDGLIVDFSPELNTVIGGRGTGKSTLLECIRYCLDSKPMTAAGERQHKGIINENLGKQKALIEVHIRSASQRGGSFVVSRRFGEEPIVKDQNGSVSSLLPSDLLPGIEIYGQGEVFEITSDPDALRELLRRFWGEEAAENASAVIDACDQLTNNINQLAVAMDGLALLEEQAAQAPRLREQVDQYKQLGIEESLEAIPLLERERHAANGAKEEIEMVETGLDALREAVPDPSVLGDVILDGLTHSEVL